MASASQFTEFKTWLGVTSTTYDADIMRALDAAIAFAERYTGLTFTPTDYTETRDGEGGKDMVLERAPVSAVTSVTVCDDVIPESTDWATEGWFRSGNVLRLRGYEFTEGGGNVVVVYTAGYDSPPADLLQACYEIGGVWWEERNRLGMKSKSMGQENVTFHETHMNEGVKHTLDAHRRVIL